MSEFLWGRFMPSQSAFRIEDCWMVCHKMERIEKIKVQHGKQETVSWRSPMALLKGVIMPWFLQFSWLLSLTLPYFSLSFWLLYQTPFRTQSQCSLRPSRKQQGTASTTIMEWRYPAWHSRDSTMKFTHIVSRQYFPMCCPSILGSKMAFHTQDTVVLLPSYCIKGPSWHEFWISKTKWHQLLSY